MVRFYMGLARWLAMLGALVALPVSSLVVGLPAPAYACSAGSDFDPVASSDVVVAGRVLSWGPASDVGAAGGFQAVRIKMQVAFTLKGIPGPTIEFVDGASLSAHGPGWAGGSGACGAFDFDPTGKFAVLGLTRDESGILRSHRLRTFLIGDVALGREDEIVASQFGSLLPDIRPTTTGDGGLLLR